MTPRARFAAIPINHLLLAAAAEPPLAVATIGDLVRDPALTVGEATPLREVRRLLAEYRVPAVAVLDDGDAITGIVTRTDVLLADDDARAADAMSCYVLALPATASIARAAALVGFEGVNQVLVIDTDRGLIGMVSAIDLVRYFADA
jgi:CBS domain-containing protein